MSEDMFLKEKGRLTISYEEYKTLLEKCALLSYAMLYKTDLISDDRRPLHDGDFNRAQYLYRLLQDFSRKYHPHATEYFAMIIIYSELQGYLKKYEYNFDVREKPNIMDMVGKLHYEDLHNIQSNPEFLFKK